MPQNRNEWIGTLFKQEYKKMIHAAYRMTGNVETAQDMVQSTFLLATMQFDRLSAHPAPEAWLMLTLRNLVWNENRRQKTRIEIPLDNLLDYPTSESVQSLDELLPRQLSEEDRQVLIWRFEEKMSYAEMASRLELSETGCRSRVSRAIARCKKLLGGSSP